MSVVGNATDGAATLVPASTAPVTLVAPAANGSRRGVVIHYAGAATMYLLLSNEEPSATKYTLPLGDGHVVYFEVPWGYSGAIRAVWTAAIGNAAVTVLT